MKNAFMQSLQLLSFKSNVWDGEIFLSNVGHLLIRENNHGVKKDVE